MLRQISLSIFGIGFLLFLLGIFQLASGAPDNTVESLAITSSTERSAAIKAAKAAGKKDYSFVTRFTPGIGVVADPERYRNDILNQLQDSLKTTN